MIENKTVFEDSNCVDIDERFYHVKITTFGDIMTQKQRNTHFLSK